MARFVLRKNSAKYSKQDCLDFVLKFRQENDRNPVTSEIRELHKKGLCPNSATFTRYGGLPFLEEGLGLEPTKTQTYEMSHGDVRMAVLKWGKKLLCEGKDPARFSKDIPISEYFIRKYYDSPRNCLVVLGLARVRESKLCNQQPKKKDTYNEISV